MKKKYYQLMRSALAVLVVISVYYIIDTGTSQKTDPPPTQTALTVVTTTSTIPVTLPPGHPPIVTEPPDTTTTTLGFVRLRLFIPDPQYELCCGIIPTRVKIWATPEIHNSGTLTAHNVMVNFELRSVDGDIISFEEGNSLEREVGDIQGGETVSEFVEVTISLIDGYSLQENGAIAVYNLKSDEQNISLEERFTVPEDLGA